MTVPPSPVPTLAERIGAAILARIAERSLAPGARLPSIRAARMEPVEALRSGM